jgi:hypothetical protein
MAYASALNDAGPPSILQPGSRDRDRRRLGRCLAISSIVIVSGLAILPLELQLDRIRRIPVALDVRVSEPAKPSAKQALPPAAAVPSSVADPQTAAAPSTADEAAPPQATVHEPPVDWQRSLEGASSDTVERSAETASLHPELDERRRLAAARYAEPKTGKPPPIWEHVEQDLYGRTVVRFGNCYKVLDDPNVGNRYAFETFEKSMKFCYLSNREPRNLPWVEEITERYAYLRNPDGGRVSREDQPSP